MKAHTEVEFKMSYRSIFLGGGKKSHGVLGDFVRFLCWGDFSFFGGA